MLSVITSWLYHLTQFSPPARVWFDFSAISSIISWYQTIRGEMQEFCNLGSGRVKAKNSYNPIISQFSPIFQEFWTRRQRFRRRILKYIQHHSEASKLFYSSMELILKGRSSAHIPFTYNWIFLLTIPMRTVVVD